MAKVHVISQSTTKTVVKCPKCKQPIDLHHTWVESANDEIGRLDLGHQNYMHLVCMNRIGHSDNRKYCDFADDVTVSNMV